jgi:hypothetical protein
LSIFLLLYLLYTQYPDIVFKGFSLFVLAGSIFVYVVYYIKNGVYVLPEVNILLSIIWLSTAILMWINPINSDSFI